MHAMQQHASSASSASSAAIPGWFTRQKTRWFGQRDPVEAQLRDIARQGTFGAAVSHFFATLLIILFSTASLIALGADSLRAVLASLAHGTVDIPNAVATGVTALLVPAMDVAMLRAASKIRILATRRASRSEMALHVAVLSVISVIEASTYIYMAGLYEHPVGAVAWALIAARAITAPLIGVYLAMDRPHPVTSRDILAQVELGAGRGVIRDMTEIANDSAASLPRKLELFGASAVMREAERDRLRDLVAVAEKYGATAVDAVPGLPRARIVAAGSELGQPIEQVHTPMVDTTAYRAMHDGYGDEMAMEIADEVEYGDGYDGVDSDPLGYHTQEIAAIDLYEGMDSAPVTSRRKQTTQSANDSGARNRHQHSKTMSASHQALRNDAKQSRKRLIREAGNTILDERVTAGQTINAVADYAAEHPALLAEAIRQRAHLDVRPSAGTAKRVIGPWKASRLHRIETEREPLNSQPIIDEDIVEMLAREEALV